MADDNKKSMFYRPKLIKTVRVEGRNKFVPSSYYFALYDDGSYSLYDGETFKYLSGNKRFNFGSMIRETKATCNFHMVDSLIKNYRTFYDAVHDYDQILGDEANVIADELGIKQHYLSLMYYYNPDDSKDEYIWENYKKMRKLFIDKCDKLGISYESDSNKIISDALYVVENTVDERFKDYKNDLSYCTSIEAINKKYSEELAKATTEFDLSRISSNFSFARQDAIDFPSSFFELTDRAIIALKNGKKSDRELLKKYTEFLIALPSFCQIISHLDKCSSDAKKRKKQLKLSRLYENTEFIANLENLIDHGEDEIFWYHAAKNEGEAERIINEGLYMYSDRLDSTSFPEFSTRQILEYDYGNDFASYDDYIIVISQPKDRQIVRKLSDKERENVFIVPRRVALYSKPTDVVESQYIVGYVDKNDGKVVQNPNYVNKEKLSVGGRNEK